MTPWVVRPIRLMFRIGSLMTWAFLLVRIAVSVFSVIMRAETKLPVFGVSLATFTPLPPLFWRGKFSEINSHLH